MRTLMEHDLVDEMRLKVFPVVLGAGNRLFGETSAEKSMRLVDVPTLDGDNGDPAEPADLGLPPDIPSRVRHVVTFEPVDGTTRLTVTEYGYTSEQTRDISKLGLEQRLDKMTANLADRKR